MQPSLPTFVNQNLPRLLALLFLIIGIPGGAQAVTLNSQEQSIANSLRGSGQRRDRDKMVLDARLTQVARARAMDMAKRGYFDHVNPDGNGPNYLAKQTGYKLPSFWSGDRRANNIESIGAGYTSASQAWSGWMGSSGHKTHLLATESFYRDQTAYGIGYYYSASSQYKHYWVVITAPPSPLNTLTITSPGVKVTAPNVSVAGTASGTAQATAIRYRLENTGGIGAWLNASVPPGVSGTWSAPLAGLVPGVNTIRAQLFDLEGGMVREAVRAVRYIIVKPLTVAITGGGKVTAGFAGTTQRELGVPLTIAAVPLAGNILDHWDGVPLADPYAARATFAMAEGLSITAHFIPSPYIGREGMYGGTFGDSHENSGSLRVRMTGQGAFTGAFFFGGVRRGVTGRFDSRGIATVRAGAFTFALQMDLAQPGSGISGTISDGNAALALGAGRITPQTPGRYTLHIAPDTTQPATPQGYGFATASVSASGAITLAGNLANGTAFTASSFVTGGGSVPVYLPLYAATGSIAGDATFDGTAFGGTLRWAKPARPGARYYPESFTAAHTLSGARYTAPAANAPALTIGPSGAAVVLGDGDLPADVTQTFTFAANQRTPVLSSPVASGVKLNINATTGRFAGSYVHPTAGVRPFSGMIGGGLGRGYVLGNAQAGTALLGAQ